MSTIRLDKKAIATYCKSRHIQRLSIFGSALRSDFNEDSDVDVLVEFEPGYVPGFAFFTMQDELSEMIGRKVDLNTPQFLSPYFRDQVIAEAEVEYAQE